MFNKEHPKIDMKEKNEYEYWKEVYYAEFKNPKIAEKWAMKRAKINSDYYEQINPKRVDRYFIYVDDYLKGAVSCYLMNDWYPAKALCRTIIEICVKSNLKMDLNESLNRKKHIENTSWDSAIKTTASKIWENGNKFVHLNPEEIGRLEFERSMEKFAREARSEKRWDSDVSTREFINDTIKIIIGEFGGC